jgi:hypothetical protein
METKKEIKQTFKYDQILDQSKLGRFNVSTARVK